MARVSAAPSKSPSSIRPQVPDSRPTLRRWRPAAGLGVLQLDLGTVEQAVVGLAVGTDDDFRLELEFTAGAVRSIVIVVSTEELGVTAERNSDLRLSGLRYRAAAAIAVPARRAFFMYRSLIGSESFGFSGLDETHDSDQTQQ